jgi:ABC-2 type transport system ATP-binding protein
MHIAVQSLQKQYNGQTVLDVDQLRIESGELVGLVGNNGAGKTTFLRLVLDLIRAGQGSVFLNDMAVHEQDDWKKETGSYLDEGFLLEFLSPEEYFYFTGERYGLQPAQVDEMLQSFERFMNGEILGQGKDIRQFSSGNKQKIGIMAAMLVQPRLLVLDEPFNYLDPSSQILIKNRLKQQNDHRKTSMIISSHNLNHLADICTRVLLLEKGRIIKDIRPQNGDLAEVDHYFSQQAI